VTHQHGDLAPEVLLVKLERLLAVAAIVEISVKLHVDLLISRRTKPG
jgi:hypothetical protein